ncbi:N-acetylmuramoyl-L-alanine amidase [Eubacterium callanderi]|uniref:peptidoglycan-binding protein n=1 Tax=Eubacterium callanderi TaxID=53442 RepID=UPI0008E57E30|nr:peptidoglycan-binding protein [Eubacterium callanderi]SFP03197.1 N-acetylmuramoyl-L-alanine amidase [Eubacterium callanderi]
MSVDSFIAQGHGRSTDGSWDCGCVDGNYTEEALMGPITRAFVDTLRAHGLSVESDVDTGNDRNITYCVRDANNARARIYVSCHCDWNQAPSGTYPICHPNSPEGLYLAQCLDNAVRARIPIGTRGILRRADWEVTDTDMPAVIFETGSIRQDIDILRDKAAAYGTALACGVMDYFGITYGDVPIAPSNPNVTNPPESSDSDGDIDCRFGDENIVVGQLQRDLRAMAYEDENGNELSIDDDFGQATEYAVKRLQSCHGLEIDGIYGPLSDAALMGEIRQVQETLVAKGYNLHVDGAVGQQTDAAIRDFQAKNGLGVDGIVGNATRAALGI